MKRDPEFDSSTDLGKFDLNAKRVILLAEWLGWKARWGSTTHRMVILVSPNREKQLNIPTTSVNQKRVLSWAHALATYSPKDRLEDAIDGKIPDNPELASMLTVIGTKKVTRKAPATPKQKEKTALGIAIEEALEKKAPAAPAEVPATLRMAGEWYEYTEGGVTKYVCRAPHASRQPFYAKSKSSAMGHSNAHQPAEWRKQVAEKSAAARRRQVAMDKAAKGEGPWPEPEQDKVAEVFEHIGETLDPLGDALELVPVEPFVIEEKPGEVTVAEVAKMSGRTGDILDQITELVAGPLVSRVLELERELERTKTERDGLRQQAETAQENLRALQEMINGLMGKG